MINSFAKIIKNILCFDEFAPQKKKSKRFKFHRSFLCSRHDPTREAQGEFQRRKPYCGAAPRPNARCSRSTTICVGHAMTSRQKHTREVERRKPYSDAEPPRQRTLFTFRHSLLWSRHDPTAEAQREFQRRRPCSDPAPRRNARRSSSTTACVVHAMTSSQRPQPCCDPARRIPRADPALRPSALRPPRQVHTHLYPPIVS